MSEEIWKDIEGYAGYYQVSSFGRVRSLTRSDNMGRIVRGGILCLDHQKNKYLKISLQKDNVRKRIWVHRLVALTFLPSIPGKDQVNHIDGDPTNNHLSNLEWCTPSENMKHCFKYLNPPLPGLGKKGKEVHNARAVVQLTVAGEEVGRWEAMADAARAINGKMKNISACVNGKQKTAHGYKWQYAK